jgi:SNF2 family DNA or RNA helicase
MKKQLLRFDKWLADAGLDSKSHQKKGLEWVLQHELAPVPMNGVRGGIIADDMGLGKTIVMLGLIVSNFLPKTIIVLPRALLEQWEKEIVRHFGHHPIVFHGNRLKESKYILSKHPEKAHIVLTTYGIVQTRKDKNCPLFKIKWNRLIADEAHAMRNEKKLFKNMIKIKADIKWMVTGTPLQNRNQDILALYKIIGLMPALKNMNNDELKPLQKIKTIFKQHALRRTKESIGLKLPPCKEHTVICKWRSSEEKQLAEQIHSNMAFPNVTPKNVNRVMSLLAGNTLVWLIRMRQVCLNPLMLKKTYKKLIEDGIIENKDYFKNIKTQSKIQQIVETIQSRNPKRGKIVFCHFHGEMDLLKEKLLEKKITVTILDGRAKPDQNRFATQKVIENKEFKLVCKKWANCDSEIYKNIKKFMMPQVLIVQLQTASEGLNLQHFKEIYFTSPWWNPSLEAQAIARAHRIGQKDNVDVFRFIMDNFGPKTMNMDSYCAEIQKVKREMAEELYK